MIKYFGCLLVVLIAITRAMGQNEYKIQPPALGIHFFFETFRGADSVKSTSPFNKTEPGLAITYLQGLHERVNLHISLAGSLIDFPFKNANRSEPGNKKLLLEADASLQYRIIPYPHALTPYLSAGLGFSKYSNYFGSFIPAGIGMQANLSQSTFLLLALQYRIPLTSTQNDHFLFSVGISGIVGKKKIKKVISPLSIPSKIILDSDGDGIADSLDECPDIPGLAAYKGCPDQDGDGIPDKEDKCPTVPGFVRYSGCPIPDTDQDGINDEEDSCITIRGLKKNHGCPLKEEMLNEQLAIQAKNIFFETDQYTLLPASYKSLNDVIEILKKYPQIHLIIEGHTDNTGAALKNQLLSENRALSVLHYFTNEGNIEASRLSTAGYGASRPITDNKTTAGKAANRRVEIKIAHEHPL